MVQSVYVGGENMDWLKSNLLRIYNFGQYKTADLVKFVREKIEKEVSLSGFKIRKMSDVEILSIAKRLALLVESSHKDLAEKNNKNIEKITNVTVRKDVENYASIPFSGSEIDITFVDTKSLKIFLDIDNGDLIFRSRSNIIKGNVDTFNIVSYCFSDKAQLYKVLLPSREKDDKGIVENDLNNLIICDRFDPVDSTSFNSFIKNKKQNGHKNNFKKLDGVKSKEELDIIKYYYGEDVPVPHFHFGTKSYSIQNGGGQLAITLRGLSIYLNDLANEYNRYNNGEAGDFKLLRYNIGIPFYDIATGRMKFDFKSFFDKMNGVLKGLLVSNVVDKRNKEKIKELYKTLEMYYISNSDGCGDALSIIAKVMDCVDVVSSEISPQTQSKIMTTIQDCCSNVCRSTQVKDKSSSDQPSNGLEK